MTSAQLSFSCVLGRAGRPGHLLTRCGPNRGRYRISTHDTQSVTKHGAGGGWREMIGEGSAQSSNRLLPLGQNRCTHKRTPRVTDFQYSSGWWVQGDNVARCTWRE